MRIWLDTDIGTDVDDALALGYVLRHPELELVGLSTVFGDIPLRDEIARALLLEAGRSTVPVLSGMGVPLSERRHGIMFGHEGLGLFEDPRPTLRTREESGARRRIEQLAEAIGEAAPDIMVAIGPMTNIGALAGIAAELPPLTVMGGKLTDVMLPGMVEEISEWNWFCDPQAVRRTLAADHRVTPLVIPAEVT
ncbi:MAG: nucleoside hydrolase, partial [Acidimicrobiales bacterium]